MNKIKSFNQLPEGYKVDFNLDMKNNKKIFVWINIGTILMIIPFILALFIFELKIIFNLKTYFIALLCFFVIIIIHELIHAIFFKLGTKEKIKFGFHGFAASAGAPNVYFYKKHYLIVGLAPTVILNIIFLILCFFFTGEVFSILYFVFALHFSGCIGDIYVTFKLLKYKKDTLIEDKGISMKFFVRESKDDLKNLYYNEKKLD